MAILKRRQFFRAAGSLAAGAVAASLARASDLPKNTHPRAISGDAIEPAWGQRLTLKVGRDEGDFIGGTDRVIQAAVDYVARLGGGTVRVGPGTYRLRNSVFLQPHVRLQGSGPDTVLLKEPAVTTSLIVDGDHWDQEVTLADPAGFEVGDGVRLVGKDPFDRGTCIIQRTLVASAGNRFKLDRPLGERYHLSGDPKIATNFALVQGTKVADAIVEHLTIDGNKAHNEMLDRGKFDDGSMRLDSCNRIVVRGLTIRNFRTDGIVWSISHDLLVEQCTFHKGDRFALHPGSGSQRSIVQGNRVLDCGQGVYFCWGAQHGLVERNVIEGCAYGMTIGHRDTDNLIRDNDIRRSRIAGIHFRSMGGEQKAKAFGAHRNRIERNRIIDSGPETGVAIDITGGTESITVSANELRETRSPLARIGIRIGHGTQDIRCVDNQIAGFAEAISDLRKA